MRDRTSMLLHRSNAAADGTGGGMYGRCMNMSMDMNAAAAAAAAV